MSIISFELTLLELAIGSERFLFGVGQREVKWGSSCSSIHRYVHEAGTSFQLGYRIALPRSSDSTSFLSNDDFKASSLAQLGPLPHTTPKIPVLAEIRPTRVESV